MITQPVIPVAILLPLLLAAEGILIYRVIRMRWKPLAKLLSILRLTAILSLFFVINLRIMREQTGMDAEMKNTDVLFVTDTTISMWAQDYAGSKPRMDGVQTDLRYIMQELYGGSFALIRFDNRSQILAPFTQDADTVTDALETIKAPDRYYANGSSLNTPYEDMEKLLQSSAKKEDGKTYLFFISDGEITDDSALRSFSDLSGLIDGGAVLGYGTEAGGRMAESRYYSYLRDPDTYEAAVSHLDESNLRQIAADLGIPYIHMNSKGNVTAVCADIRAESTNISGKKDLVTYEDTYYLYVIPLLLMLLWQALAVMGVGGRFPGSHRQ